MALDTLAFDFFFEVVDCRLCAGRIGIDAIELFERLERALLLPLLLEDLGKAFERLEVIGFQRERAPVAT